jgi:NADP-dependent 3-hydroxy acid dehydrogenase YdfG
MSAPGTVVVSGAGTGIGRAVARRLSAGGFHVTAVGRRKEPLDQLAGESSGQIAR